MTRVVELGKPVYKLIWGNFPKDATGSVVNLDGDVTISGVGFRHVGRAVEFILPPSYIIADNLPASIVYKVNNTVVSAEQLTQTAAGGSVDLSEIEDRLTALEEAPAPATSAFALDRTTLNATHGDHFTGSDINTSKWSRGGAYVDADETAADSWLKVTGRPAGSWHYQTAPASGNWTMYGKFSMTSNGQVMFGLMATNNAGSGVAGGLYNNAPNGPIIGNLSSLVYNNTFQGANAPAGTIAMSGILWWCKMEKNGTAYRTASSVDGSNWGPWTSTITVTDTITRVGFGQWLGNNGPTFSVDFFDLVPF